MQRIRLVLRDQGIQVFAAFASPGHGSGTFNFVVDTGSRASFLGWEDATKMGINIEDLAVYPKPVAGFGGTAEARHLKETCFIYLTTEDNQMKTVELPDGIIVHRPPKKKSHWEPGKGVSILGRDFLKNSEMTLRVDLHAGQLFLESA